MKRTLAIIALFCLAFQGLFAQAPAPKPLRLGLGLLATGYSGDLNTGSSPFERFYPGAALSLQFASEKLLSPQLNGGFGKFIAQDRDLSAVDGVQPNTFVQTPFFFVDLRLKARFLRQKAIHPYLSAGIGMLGYTPRDADGNNLIDNFATRQEGETFGSMSANFPLHAGIEFVMNPVLMLGLEYGIRPTTTDYLDNIGQLGLRSGNDMLQTIALSVYFTFDPEYKPNSTILKGRDRN